MRVPTSIFLMFATALATTGAPAAEPGSNEFLADCRQRLDDESMLALGPTHVTDHDLATLDVQFDLGPRSLILKIRDVIIYILVTDPVLLCFPSTMQVRPIIVLMRNGQRRPVDTETWVVPSQLSVDATSVLGKLGVEIPRDIDPDQIAAIVLRTTAPTP